MREGPSYHDHGERQSILQLRVRFQERQATRDWADCLARQGDARHVELAAVVHEILAQVRDVERRRDAGGLLSVYALDRRYTPVLEQRRIDVAITIYCLRARARYSL